MTGGEGGGFWSDNGDGTFTVTTNFGGASGLSWLDLYAMGLAEASEVPDLFVLRNLEPAPGNDRPRRSGQYRGTFHADKEVISIDQIVAAMGPREPPATRSRKEFNIGFVYLLKPGKTPTPVLLQLHKDYIDRVVEYWSDVTGGRSRITVAVPGVEWVPLTTFTDDPILPGVTPIKAVHFMELRERIDLLREGAGLAPFAWTDPILTAGVTPVRLSHLLELREALAAAYRASGRSGPVFTDVAPMSGRTPIRAVHLTELRRAVVALQ